MEGLIVLIIFAIIFFQVFFFEVIFIVFDLGLLAGCETISLGLGNIIFIVFIDFILIIVLEFLKIFIVFFEVLVIEVFFIVVFFLIFISIKTLKIFLIETFQILRFKFIKILILNIIDGFLGSSGLLRLDLSLGRRGGSLLLGLVGNRCYLWLDLGRSLGLLGSLRGGLLDGLGGGVVRLLGLNGSLGLDVQFVQVISNVVDLLRLGLGRLGLLVLALGDQGDIGLGRLAVSNDMDFSVL